MGKMEGATEWLKSTSHFPPRSSQLFSESLGPAGTPVPSLWHSDGSRGRSQHRDALLAPCKSDRVEFRWGSTRKGGSELSPHSGPAPKVLGCWDAGWGCGLLCLRAQHSPTGFLELLGCCRQCELWPTILDLGALSQTRRQKVSGPLGQTSSGFQLSACTYSLPYVFFPGPRRPQTPCSPDLAAQRREGERRWGPGRVKDERHRSISRKAHLFHPPRVGSPAPPPSLLQLPPPVSSLLPPSWLSSSRPCAAG